MLWKTYIKSHKSLAILRIEKLFQNSYNIGTNGIAYNGYFSFGERCGGSIPSPATITQGGVTVAR